jgi:hypothetical protein
MVTKYVPHKFAKDTTTRAEIPDFMSPSVIRVGSESTIQETTQFMNKKNIGSVLNFKERTMSLLVSSRKRIYRERSWADGYTLKLRQHMKPFLRNPSSLLIVTSRYRRAINL